MCLGMPGKVVRIEGRAAIVDFWGVLRRVRVDTLEENIAPGDYIVNHAGFAVRRIAPEHVTDTLAMYEVVLTDGCGDPTAEFEGELAALTT